MAAKVAGTVVNQRSVCWPVENPVSGELGRAKWRFTFNDWWKPLIVQVRRVHAGFTKGLP